MTDQDFLPIADSTPTPTGPLTAIGWLLFAVLLVLSPVIVWAVWGWLL